MGRSGLHPAAVARTTPEARRGRSIADSLIARGARLIAPLTRFVLSLPDSRLRAVLVRYAAARVFAAFNRRDWEINTIFFDPSRYEFQPGDLAAVIPGIDEVYRGTEGYLRAMHEWLDAWSDMRTRVEDVVMVSPGRLFLAVRFIGSGAASGVPVDQITGLVVDLEAGLVVNQRYWWEAVAARQAAGLTRASGGK